MLPRVRDDGWYRAFDQGHADPKSRIGGVPVDDARLFFRSHRTRLRNLASAGGTDEKMRALAGRRKMVDAAERIYRRLQMVALGLRRASADRGGAELER